MIDEPLLIHAARTRYGDAALNLQAQIRAAQQTGSLTTQDEIDLAGLAFTMRRRMVADGRDATVTHVDCVDGVVLSGGDWPHERIDL